MKNAIRAESAEKRNKRRERDEACAALDRVWASRPLKPPPGRPAHRTRTAGELAAANDRRLGLLGATGPFLDSIND